MTFSLSLSALKSWSHAPRRSYAESARTEPALSPGGPNDNIESAPARRGVETQRVERGTPTWFGPVAE
jgi:hypothetical protein